jgi:hypothetical protein
MPSWFVHIQAAAQTMETLRDSLPAGSPLTQAEANDLFTAAHDNRNYLAAGALGPDLFFLLPDFKGDVGKGVGALADFLLDKWKFVDDNFVTQWERWMTPVLDEQNQIVNSLTGGMLGEVSQLLTLLSGSLTNYLEGLAAQTVDVFGLMTSGTQTGYADSGFTWSDMFHYRKTYQFARRLYANALKADVDQAHGGTSKVAKPADEPSRVPKQQAFALGWINHCATDVAAHPFTNAKCAGPYRTHWHRHHVVENHMDAFVYNAFVTNTLHRTRGMNYDALDVAALHARMAFLKSPTSPDPTMPDDNPFSDYFPSSFKFPTDASYPETEHTGDAQKRKKVFDIDTGPLPEHICELLLQTMQDVYTGPDDMDGPRILQWDQDLHEGTGGRPTVQVLQDMYQLAYDYAKYTSSSGLSPRKPMPPDVITDLDFPIPPGLPADGNADPGAADETTVLDVLLAIVSFATWLAEVAEWLVTSGPALLAELATYPAREALYSWLITPAWGLYMMSRKPLVLEGYLTPKPEEISTGLVQLGADEKGALTQLRADLDAPTGVGLPPGVTEPSGLDPRPGASPLGYGLDPAYPRAMLTDLDPPWLALAPIDAPSVPSEFVAPWRYPDHNMAGMRNGWEAPRTHVGPYLQGQTPDVLMARLPGTDAARHRYEAARTPEETEAVSAELLAMPGQHLGDPIDYGVYLIGQLTGTWQSPTGYVAHDHAAPLPDFNLDADRGYAYQCWDYLRHPESKPPSPRTDLDTNWPDQWLCAPQMIGFLSEILGVDPDVLAARIRDWYGYAEPCTVPQRYDPKDNPHHRSRYDPLKILAHQYLPRAGSPPIPRGYDETLDLQVSIAEIRAAGMSPTGRRPL